MKNNFRERILELLKSRPDGLTILDISIQLRANRNTITKYIYELSGAGVINQRRIGVAKLCSLSKYARRDK
ncbi:MAG: hypothetical protein HYW23_04120 [Candidatus Aenigmarchaeota archaeon]|nr:hypothetical protein [Candidatus Aenigmarchaeota archaeon]